MASVEMSGNAHGLVGEPEVSVGGMMRPAEDSTATPDGEFWACCGGSGDNWAARQVIGGCLIVVIAVVFLIMDFSISDQDEENKHRTLGILLVVVISWLFEVIPIPITGLLVGPLLFLFDVYTLAEAISGYVSNLTLILFGSYFIAIAMERHGLDRRFANAATSLSFVRGNAARERLAVMSSGWVLSMWVSNTGAVNILTPIFLKSQGAVKGLPFPAGPRRSGIVGGLLAVCYGCNAGGMGTLVGTPTNIIAQGALKGLDINIDFLTWMLLGVPAAALVMGSAYIVLYVIYKPLGLGRRDSGEVETALAVAGVCEEQQEAEAHAAPAPMSWGEKLVFGSFLITVFFWLFPSIYKMAGFEDPDAVAALLPAGVVVILGTLPLFLLPDSDYRKRVLPWSEAKKADWGVIMLVGGGSVLGSAMRDTGVAAQIAEGIIGATGVSDIWTLTFLVVFLTIFATEVCSNTAITAIMVPIVIGISESIDPDPKAAIGPVIGVAFAASCAFMMPIATPPNYIVLDTGHFTISEMAKAGVVVNLVSSVLIWITLRLLLPLVFAHA